MPLILDIKNPEGERAHVYANHPKTLSIAMKIIDIERGQEHAWASMQRPHIVQDHYAWELTFDDCPPKQVVLEKGSTIHLYR
jgi:hypothetical protein